MTPSRIEAYLHSIDPSSKAAGLSGSGLGELCAEITGVTGAGIMLMAEGDHRGCLSASDPTMAVIENLQFTLGEGPCIDAFATGRAVQEPDLAAVTTTRWPLFTGPAVEAGVEAVFAFPLLIAGTCVGALDLYNATPGPLDDGQLAEAGNVATMVAEVVLTLQNDTATGELPEAFKAATKARAVVYQAAGMTAVQLDISVDDALVRLRGNAFAVGRPVNDLARDVTERTLRLDGLDSSNG
jgi:GAF domain-containing protein